MKSCEYNGIATYTKGSFWLDLAIVVFVSEYVYSPIGKINFKWQNKGYTFGFILFANLLLFGLKSFFYLNL